MLGRISVQQDVSEQLSTVVKRGSSTTVRNILPSFKRGNIASKLKLPQNVT